MHGVSSDLPDPAGSVRGQVRALTRRFLRCVRGVEVDPTADAIHDLRVASRRLVQALDAFQPLLPAKARRRLRKRAVRARRGAARVRDLDVHGDLLRSAGLADDHPLPAELAAERAKALEALLARLAALPNRQTLGRWAKKLDGREPSGDGPNPLPALAKAFLRQGRALAAGRRSPRRYHRFRVCTKRLRYTLELFRERLGAGADEPLATLQRLQDRLGALNDCLVACDRYAERSRSDSDLAQALERVAGLAWRHEQGFLGAWNEAFGCKGRRRAWVRAMRTQAGAATA